MAIKAMTRKFQLGAMLLEDPLPNGSLVDVVEVFSGQFPMVRLTSIFESDARMSSCNTYLVYDIKLPPVKVNG